MSNATGRPSSGNATAVRIEHGRLTLRSKRPEDARDDYAWRSDPELVKFDAVPPLRMSWEDYQRVYAGEIRNPPGRQLSLGIEDEIGEHIGNVMYYNLDEFAGQVELGIMIGNRDYWSRGYGPEAVRLMVEHIFDSTSVHRVYLHTLTWNVRAQKSFSKAGFVPVGEVLRNGYNFVIMELWRDLDGSRPASETATTA
ncbi:MAG: GNAT family N-acetyltransferase [Chloroflexota bacterium]